ncbi:MAG: arsenite S-adenosylmethyltransferase [Sulfobacillus acidophilus]|uniref:Arsenite methyltransferase n=1 Tax=Sulfobacillus acidophilus TaxID=53633 RepID=A0A2T2WIV9_9FIRM|nr:MAG: arsenite S-adenosylmethyltransferase [Sulfobacillus acidophilus]
MPAGRLSTAARQTAIQERYGRIAEMADQVGCGCGCGEVGADADVLGAQLGYTPDELASVPSGANLGLGCGNPIAIASLKPGETVLDLGSGAGLDCFLAARQVGDHGRVIGVDMTPAMIARSRHNAQSQGDRYANVEFRLGEIEHLPVADASVDVILSNCVINLASNKRQVFQEAYRVLKSGGRLAISDIVATREIPPDLREDVALWTGCMAGAASIGEIETLLTNVGFVAVSIVPQSGSHDVIREWGPNTPLTDYVVSAAIEGIKP